MHIPVLLCGLICGPLPGAFLGAILPVLNTALTGMPAVYPTLPLMTVELAIYGLVSGFMQTKTPLGNKKWGIYPSLIIAMLAGRAVYGLAGRYQQKPLRVRRMSEDAAQ
jgi:niacin transporter